jgi:hypothetical protein
MKGGKILAGDIRPIFSPVKRTRQMRRKILLNAHPYKYLVSLWSWPPTHLHTRSSMYRTPEIVVVGVDGGLLGKLGEILTSKYEVGKDICTEFIPIRHKSACTCGWEKRWFRKSMSRFNRPEEKKVGDKAVKNWEPGRHKTQ